MSPPSKVGGNVKEAAGFVKEKTGAVFGNHSMEAEESSLSEGHAEVDAAKAKGYAEGTGNAIGGNIKHGVGKLIGNEQMQAEGKMKQVKGDAQKATNHH